jgi:hypothetical protein
MSGIDRGSVEDKAAALLRLSKEMTGYMSVGSDAANRAIRSEARVLKEAAMDMTALLTALAAAEAREAKLREALEGVVIYGSDTLSGPVPPQRHDLIWARDGIREMVRRARAALADKGDTDNDG